MAVIHIPRRTISQPTGIVDVDWSNPLTDSLWLAVDWSGTVPRDAVSGRSFTPKGGAGSIAVRAGNAGFSAANLTDACWSLTNLPPIATNQRISTYCVFTPHTVNAASKVIYRFYGTSGSWSLNYGNGSDALLDAYARTSGNQYPSRRTVIITINTRFMSYAAHNPAVILPTFDPFPITASVSGDSAAQARHSVITAVDIAGNSASSQSVQATVEQFFHWTRELSVPERAALRENPWQIFRSTPHRIYSFAPVISIPTLSSPGVIDISDTVARPRVTLTY